MKEKVTWNISEIARIFRCSRDTARKRLKEAGVDHCKMIGPVPVYDAVDVGRALFAGERSL